MTVFAFDSEIWSIVSAYVDKLTKNYNKVNYLLVADVLSRDLRDSQSRMKTTQEAAKTFNRKVEKKKTQKIERTEVHNSEAISLKLCVKMENKIHNRRKQNPQLQKKHSVAEKPNLHLSWNTSGLSTTTTSCSQSLVEPIPASTL